MNFTNVGFKLNDDHVSAWEKHIGYSLPNDYISFLKKTNGGFLLDLPEFPIFGLADVSSACVELFYGIETGDDVTDLARAYEDYRGKLVDGCIPIAYAGGGDQVLLVLDGPLKNGVYFWDFYSRKKDMYQRIRPIATSFSKFWKSLVLVDDADR